VIIIVLDFQFKEFTRRLQFLLSLGKCFYNVQKVPVYLVLIGICLLAATIMAMAGLHWSSIGVTVVITIAAMIADSVFWMNIIQVTTQRYPTVIRGIAFGCLHGAK
jgi:hypothetical protein